MKKISFSCALGSTDIYIGKLASSLGQVTGASHAAVIASHRVAALYPWLLESRLSHLIPDDEEIKSLDRASELYGQFLSWHLDRSSLVAAAGGGAICDLVGFVASTYMRGISFLLIPTTLLAQVDAAVGGKTAVDWGGIKNVIGTFALPRATLIDPKFLLTLPPTEILNGLAEVVKYALIASPELFSFLQTNWDSLLQPDLGLMEQVIMDSVTIKLSLVESDAREANQRRLLNFGHTLAHAVEKEMAWSHGQAVAWGMGLATKISNRLGILAKEDASSILDFLEQSFPFLAATKITPFRVEKILERLEADKKREGGLINFVVLRSIGKAEVHRLPFGQLKELLDDLR